MAIKDGPGSVLLYNTDSLRSSSSVNGTLNWIVTWTGRAAAVGVLLVPVPEPTTPPPEPTTPPVEPLTTPLEPTTPPPPTTSSNNMTAELGGGISAGIVIVIALIVACIVACVHVHRHYITHSTG